MSEIIYLKDILLAKLAKKPKKTATKRAKLKPFKYEKMQAFLVERHRKKEKNK